MQVVRGPGLCEKVVKTIATVILFHRSYLPSPEHKSTLILKFRNSYLLVIGKSCAAVCRYARLADNKKVTGAVSAVAELLVKLALYFALTHIYNYSYSFVVILAKQITE